MEKPDFKQLNAQGFDGSLGQYKIIETKDKTFTLWSEMFDECCHSLDGAYDETLYNYIEGARVIEKSRHVSPISIFEMGFASGMGVTCTFKVLDELDESPECLFVSCELDEGLVHWAIEHDQMEFHAYPSLKSLEKNTIGDLTYFQAKKNNSQIIVLIGDARVSVPLAKQLGVIDKFHCFYQDPFSPRKNPTLWTIEWFELLANLAYPQAWLATYSASTSVRKAMDVAGWGVFNRKGFHGKRSSTYAIIGEKTQEEVSIKLAQSSVGPLTDQSIENNKE